MLESKPIYAALGIPATADFKGTAPAGGGTAMYELRSYQLHPGYGSVPKLYEAFGKGYVDQESHRMHCSQCIELHTVYNSAL